MLIAENMNHIQNLRVDYEKERSNRELSLIQKNYEMGQRTKNIFPDRLLDRTLPYGGSDGLFMVCLADEVPQSAGDAAHGGGEGQFLHDCHA